MKKTMTMLLLVMFSGPVLAQNYVDKSNREWKRITPTYGLTVAALAAVCSQDPCRGSAGGIDFTGWTWANQTQVVELMREFQAGAPVADAYQTYQLSAQAFQRALGTTLSSTNQYSSMASTTALTSSVDPISRKAILGDVYSETNSFYSVGFRFAVAENSTPYSRSAFMYRRASSTLPPVPVVVAPRNCSINGRVILHGSSVVAYQSSRPALGRSCVSQVRVCSNGLLSGSYTSLTCTAPSR